MDSIQKRYVGFVRSMAPNKELAHEACSIQKSRIELYCKEEGIECINILENYGYKDDCRRKEKGLAKELGLPELQNKFIPEGWSKLLEMIIKREIDVVLVDSKMRLAKNEIEAGIISRICEENNITVVEIPQSKSITNPEDRLYLYHCTNNPSKRVGIVMTDIDEMYIYATSLGGEVAGLFVDMEFKGRDNLERAIEAVGQGTLIVKNYLHLKRYTGASFDIFRRIEENGGKIISQEEGTIRSLDKDVINALRKKPIRVAFYDSQIHKYDRDNQDLELQKVRAYIRCYSNGWILDENDIYIDKYGFKKQSKLDKFIENQDKYELLIVDSYSRVSVDISRFLKIIRKIHIPIYSMKEEF